MKNHESELMFARRQFLLIAPLLAMLGFAWQVNTCAACSCGETTPELMFNEYASLIFQGTVVEVRTVDRDDETLTEATFEIEVIWKGAVNSTNVVRTPSDGAACGVGFQLGESYLVYASDFDSDGVWDTSWCDRTVPVDRAAGDLAFLATKDPLFVATQSPGADAAIHGAWARTDLPVATGIADRTWMWGPNSIAATSSEPYVEAPNGMREVRYFDKGRLELTEPEADPAHPWYVTTGLLAWELITGQVQVGNEAFDELLPAEIPVAGDIDSVTGPTYATLSGLLNEPPQPVGSLVLESLERDRLMPERMPGSLVPEVSIAITDDVTNHSIAAPFWEFMHDSGIIYEDYQFSTEMLFEAPYYAIGRPITEPYWTFVKVNGIPRNVLFQCFERRCLTYTPENPEGWQVEAGNVGQHYVNWRYNPGRDQLRVIDTNTPDAALAGTDGNYAVWSNTKDREILAASLSVANPFAVVSVPALRRTVTVDQGIIVWDETDPGCAFGCATIYGLRIGEIEPFIVAAGGRSGEAEIIQGDVVFDFPWVAWLRVEGNSASIMVRDIATMEAPFVVVTAPVGQLGPPALSLDRVIWLEASNGASSGPPNRLMTQRIYEQTSRVVATSVESDAYAVGNGRFVYIDSASNTLMTDDVVTDRRIEVQSHSANGEIQPGSLVTNERFIFWIEALTGSSNGESVIRGYDVDADWIFQVAGPAVVGPVLNLNAGVLSWIQVGDNANSLLYAAPLAAIVPREGAPTSIAFISNRTGSDDIYTVRPDGNDLRQLTDSPENDELLTWSPDGDGIAFVRAYNDGPKYLRDLYVMYDDGSGLRQLNRQPAEYPHFDALTWSPNGQELAYIGFSDDGPGIYAFDLGDSEERRLTPAGMVVGEQFSWSPDGRRIVFSASREGEKPQLYVVDVDGSNLAQITNESAWALMPAWSPDGERIAYMVVADPTMQDQGIYLVHADGSQRTRLTDIEPTAAALVWSPDGLRLAFTSLINGNHQIFVIRRDGAGLLAISLEAPGEVSLYPDWSTDSTRIAFTSFLFGGNQEIYLVDADGTGLTQLTSDTAWDYRPAWQPGES